LMQDGEPGSDAKIKDYFMNAVHISGDNYDKLKASIVRQAESLKNRVDAKDILVDLDFAGTMKKLYATELEAAQAANNAAPASATPVDETSAPAT
jgi:hypothetical protein